jgi:putative CocE/NonD family hydrolase
MLRRTRAFAAGALIGACLLLAHVPEPLNSQESLPRGADVWIPLRDGVRLQATLFQPQGGGKFATLVYRTPYGRRSAERYTIVSRALARGYAVLLVDVRGRYGSEGEYAAYQQEGRDGYDTIEWAGAQPWSSGAVGTFGLSYPGAVQWLAAMERPPHLKAMVPAMTFSTPSNFIYSGGVFDMSWIGWIWNNIAPDIRTKKNLPGPRSGQEARASYRALREKFLNHLPLSDLQELKDVAPWYFEWMKHPPGDPWWDWAELRNKYDRAGDIAVLHFSGWYDEAYGPEGATTNLNGLRAARRKQKDARTALVMGPWVHGIPGAEERVAGERDFGPGAVIDYDGMVLDWMDVHLKGQRPDCKAPPAPGMFRTPVCGKPVKYFVVGANEWREADGWPVPGTAARQMFLVKSDELKAGTHHPGTAGGLRDKPSARKVQFAWFASDPAAPVPDAFPPYTGGHDYSSLAGRGDVLVFDSAALAEDMEVTGAARAVIYLSCDQPDTDLWVRLLDVSPDGKAINLMSPGLDVLRASYRNGGPQRELLDAGKVYKLELKHLITSNVFGKGHRIRVQISATFFPNFSRNLHTGKLEMDSKEMRRATLRIHTSAQHPSHIVLPVIPAR